MLGVINIITKRARDFAGSHLVLDAELPMTFRAGAGAGYEFKLFALDFDDPRSFEVDRWVSLDLKHRAKLSSQVATPTHPSAEFVPVEQLRAMLGLVYDLPF